MASCSSPNIPNQVTNDYMLLKIPNIETGEHVVNKLRFPKKFSQAHQSAVAGLLSRCKKLYHGPHDGNAYWYVGDNIKLELEKAIDDKHDVGREMDIYIPFLDMLETWIQFMDKYILHRSEYRSVGALVEHVALNECGVVDYGETAKRLLAISELDNTDKLVIACIHCLEDEIRELLKIVNFPHTSENNLPEASAKIMEFWRRYLKNQTHADELEELIFLVGYENESGVKFFWNKLSGEQKRRNLPAIFWSCSSYSKCTWLNKISTEWQLSLLKEHGELMLEQMRKTFVWREYFFTVAYFVRYLIPAEGYYRLLDTIASESLDLVNDHCYYRYENQMIVRVLWRFAPVQVKSYLYRQKRCQWLPFCDHDLIVEILREATTTEFNKYFFESEHGGFLMTSLSRDKHFSKLNQLFDIAFPDREENFEYKMKFINSERGSVFVLGEPITQNDEKLFDERISLFFAVNETACRFKKQFLFHTKNLNMFEGLVLRCFHTEEGVLRDTLNFGEILNVVRWFGISEPQIDEFVMKLPSIRGVQEAIFKTFRKDEALDLIDEFLDKCFNGDTRQIDRYMDELHQLTKSWEKLILHLIKKNKFDTLIGVTEWISKYDECKQRKFKETIADGFCKMERLLQYLFFEEETFDSADTFLRWCGLDSVDKLVAFKRRLFNEIEWFSIGQPFGTERTMKIVEWFGSAISEGNKVEFLEFCDPDSPFRRAGFGWSNRRELDRSISYNFDSDDQALHKNFY